MPKYRLKLKCKVCLHVYKRVVKSLDVDDPPCPKCKRVMASIGMNYDSTRAPAAVGMTNMTKAIDKTAEIVMEDYKLTNLQDNLRTGDVMAPKLAPHLQAQADNFFGGGNAARSGMRQSMANAVARGLSGQVPSSGAVEAIHAPKLKPNVRIVADDSKLRR